MAQANRPTTMNGAIDALDDAMNSNESTDLNASVTAGFDDLKAALKANSQEGAEYAQRLFNSASHEVAQQWKEVDQSVRANPWPFIGGAAIGMLAVGYMLGRRD